MESSEVWFAVLALSILLIILVLGFLVYAGLLDKVNVGAGKPPIRKVTIAYKYSRGPYSNCGRIFSEACSIAPKCRCIGLYYDDPKQVPADKLRWAVGSILSEGDELPDQKMVDLFHEKGFHLFFLPAVTNSVRTTFPFRTTLSMFIAIFRVYPLLADYVMINRLCAHPFIEIYDDKLIYFMAPLAKQDEFYVHEAVFHALQPEGTTEEDLPLIPEDSNEGVHPAAGETLHKHKTPYFPTPSPSTTEESKDYNMVGDQRDSLSTKMERSVSHRSASTGSGENKENRDANIIRGARGFSSVKPSSQVNPLPNFSKEHGDENWVLGVNTTTSSESLLNKMPPSPSMSSYSESSMVSSTTDGSSVGSFYTSQSELSYTSDSQIEFSDTDQDTEIEGHTTDESQLADEK